MRLTRGYAVPRTTEIAEWMRATYGPDHFGRCQVHRSGYPLLYRVHPPGGTRWLRVYSPGHPPGHRLKAQVAVVAALAHAGESIARPIRGKNGDFVQALQVGVEQRNAVLFSHAPGGRLERTDLSGVSALGAAVAKMHQSSTPVDLRALDEIDYDYLVKHPLQRLAPHVAAQAVLAEVRNIANDLRDRLPPDVPIGLCHGDIHPPNANINDHQTVTLLDFDELAQGPLCYDLACYWRKSALENQDHAAANREWHAFLEGYEDIRTVSADERRAVPVLGTLRAIWTMAMPADYVGIWGEDWLTDPTYFSGHAEMIRRLARESRPVG